MTYRLAALLGLLFFVDPARAQTVYTRPSIPSLRDLDRLNLNILWKTFVPIENRSDGIASVQIIDHRIYVQTRANLLIVLNEITGEEIWRRPLPRRYLPALPLAVNRNLVLVVNGPTLYLLDRADGKTKYSVDLPGTVSAGTGGRCEAVFCPAGNRPRPFGGRYRRRRRGRLAATPVDRSTRPAVGHLAVGTARQRDDVVGQSHAVPGCPEYAERSIHLFRQGPAAFVRSFRDVAQSICARLGQSFALAPIAELDAPDNAIY